MGDRHNLLLMQALVVWLILTGSIQAADPESSSELCRRMYAPVMIVHYSSHRGLLLLDTGATLTSVYGPADLLRKPEPSWQIRERQGVSQGGWKQIKEIHGIDVTVFGRTLNQTVISYNPDIDTTRSTAKIDGVLGMYDAKGLMFHVNLRQNEFTSISSLPKMNNAQRLPFEEKSRLALVPEVKVEFPVVGRSAICLDTGNSFFMTLTKPRVQHLLRAGVLKKADAIYARTAKGFIQSETYLLRSVKIAGFDFQDVLVCETAVDTLGREFMDCFDTTIDFPNGEIWLDPLETEWPLRIAPDASGLILSYRDTDLLFVVRMEPDSVAVRSGLKEGDRVLLFDGKSPKDTSMRSMRKRLTEAGTTVRMKILRDGKELDIDLPLSRSYEYPPKWPKLNTDADDFFKSLQKESAASEK